MLLHMLQCTGQPPHHKGYLVQNISSAEVEQSCNTHLKMYLCDLKSACGQ